MSLAETQRLLAEAFRQPRSLVGEPSAAPLEAIAPLEQLEIYREQFWLRHVDVLREDFASTEHLLGREAFEELARAYLLEHPSTSFTLRDLGAELPAFVGAAGPWRADPLLADLSRLEWAFVEAFDGPDAPPLDPGSIAGVPEDAWPAATIGLHASLQRLVLGHPAHEYRRHRAERPAPRRCHVVVYRGPEVLECLEIDGDAAAALDALAAGTPLGEACVRAAKASGAPPADFEAKLGGWFSEWTRLGWIRAVSIPQRPPSRRNVFGWKLNG